MLCSVVAGYKYFGGPTVSKHNISSTRLVGQEYIELKNKMAAQSFCLNSVDRIWTDLDFLLS
jgi:hypothetical protein